MARSKLPQTLMGKSVKLQEQEAALAQEAFERQQGIVRNRHGARIGIRKTQAVSLRTMGRRHDPIAIDQESQSESQSESSSESQSESRESQPEIKDEYQSSSESHSASFEPQPESQIVKQEIESSFDQSLWDAMQMEVNHVSSSFDYVLWNAMQANGPLVLPVSQGHVSRSEIQVQPVELEVQSALPNCQAEPLKPQKIARKSAPVVTGIKGVRVLQKKPQDLSPHTLNKYASRFRPIGTGFQYQMINFKGAIDIMSGYRSPMQCLAARNSRTSSFQGHGFNQDRISRLTRTQYQLSCKQRDPKCMQFLRFVDSVTFDFMFNPWCILLHKGIITSTLGIVSCENEIWKEVCPLLIRQVMIRANLLKFVDCAWWSVVYGRLLNEFCAMNLNQFIDKFIALTRPEVMKQKLVHRNLMTFVITSDCYLLPEQHEPRGKSRLVQLEKHFAAMQKWEVPMEFILEKISKMLPAHEFVQTGFRTKTIQEIIEEIQAKHPIKNETPVIEQ